ncbi:class III lanthionine synthetase LanKC [Nocardia sp. CDC159]|uniref:Class III lanthionine synthetase LanKC n=1 Tax=Nocardia pulmonis TaxID=2951408 RepID=A0A9X2IZI1_9NOCA|nr:MULTISPECIES: class III lanthionine synthetase LanKC [Nocardia]MCM6776769.1 class III lanthionine synthetase LanKC [Nocardia pulmonis]MCM6789082.1 class III lanthionine synthetase LanKC [Nocardia sp. CDC159]
MLQDAAFTFAHPDYYEPFERTDPGRRYNPTRPPAGWTRREFEVWTQWTPPHAELPEQGWKVHVSSSLATAQQVLDVVSAACAELGVAFKHLTGKQYFLWLHGKHGSRVQSGKFCALYPPTPQLAYALLERLERELAGVAGPYVLTDRRFGSSRCVSYRYGAFRPRHRLQADGTRVPVMLALDGTEVPDERRPEFLLPAGIADPFGAVPETDGEEEVSFHGYTFENVLQSSNAGGAYRARRADGDVVFVKEARAHNGYAGDEDARVRLEREYLTLRALHAAAPGLAPEPVELFTEWEHTFLVTEFVPGRTLSKWMVATSPLIRAGEDRAAFTAYYRRCTHILDQLAAQLETLHELGYAFVDLSPGNILVGDDDTVRLIDFEAAQPVDHPLGLLGTPGYEPPESRSPGARAKTDPLRVDAYALTAIAQLLIFPMHEAARRSPETLAHLYAELAELCPPPTDLWATVLRSQPAPRVLRLPAPAQVRSAPGDAVRWLRDRTAEALERMAEPDNPRWVYPTAPEGLRSNARCVAHGTAGVLHALRAAGREIDPRVVRRLRDDALRERHATGPGLMSGNAGIAWVLDDLGERDAATTLLAAASTHRLATEAASWGGGAAGVAMAHLSFFHRTGDPDHLDRAQRLLDAVPDGDALIPLLGPDQPSGLVAGRAGIALALYYLSEFTGARAPFERGLRLLRDELGYAEPIPVGAMGFRVSATDRRNMPYLACGSAGFGYVLARYLARRPDPELTELLRACVRAVGIRFTAAPGLFQGQAGTALVHTELAARFPDEHFLSDPAARATALFKYAIAGATGVRWLGGRGQRLSADLASGSAGILLALQHATAGVADPLFTLDHCLASADRFGRVGQLSEITDGRR